MKIPVPKSRIPLETIRRIKIAIKTAVIQAQAPVSPGRYRDIHTFPATMDGETVRSMAESCIPGLIWPRPMEHPY